MRIWRARVLAGVVVAGVGLTACGATASQRASTRPSTGGAALSASVPGGNPLAHRRLYVTPGSPASTQVTQLEAQGDAHDASLMQRIAREPVGNWFANSSPQVGSQVRALVSAAAAQNRVPLIVAYDIPRRDCAGSYSTGGNATAAGYMEWVGRLARGIGRHPALVILEPDAIPDLVAGCLNEGDARTRLALLGQAIGVLKRESGALVYLDAGNAGWINPLSKLVGPLRQAGIAQADGFALNVANFESTATSIDYANRLSRLLHGAHYVIDTGRNGKGPDGNQADRPTWCNPPGRALGHVPSTNTHLKRLDAYLWVKQPGVSDGNCRPGAPPAGQWWAQYALQLASAQS